MKYVILFFCSTYVLLTVAEVSLRILNAPPVRTAPRDTSIPYCPTRPFGQPQMFLPCMYSSLEKSA